MEVPPRVNLERFLNKLFIEMASRDYLGYTVYYTKDGSYVTRRTMADTIWVRDPKGRKFLENFIGDFKQAKGKKRTAALMDELEALAVIGARTAAERRERKKRPPLPPPEDIEIEDYEQIEYTVSEIQQGDYVSKKYPVTRYNRIFAEVTPAIHITEDNAESFIEYMRTFGLEYMHTLLKELGVGEGQEFRVRIMGSGNVPRVTEKGDTEVTKFGVSLSRGIYDEEGWETFSNLFIEKLEDCLIGANNYLMRAMENDIAFRGFHIEIYN